MRSAQGGVIPEEDAHARGEPQREQDTGRLHHRRELGEHRQQPRPPIPVKTPISPPSPLMISASIRNCRRMSRPGADRLADPDLARPLGHRHQHDVHDPDAADEQRDPPRCPPSSTVNVARRPRPAQGGPPGCGCSHRRASPAAAGAACGATPSAVLQVRQVSSPPPPTRRSRRRYSRPKICFIAVVYGISTWSSGLNHPWSPLLLRTPITRKLMPLSLIV